eukprot:sb/3475257/
MIRDNEDDSSDTSSRRAYNDDSYYGSSDEGWVSRIFDQPVEPVCECLYIGKERFVMRWTPWVLMWLLWVIWKITFGKLGRRAYGVPVIDDRGRPWCPCFAIPVLAPSEKIISMAKGYKYPKVIITNNL